MLHKFDKLKEADVDDLLPGQTKLRDVFIQQTLTESMML